MVRAFRDLLADSVFLWEEALIHGGIVDEPLKGVVQHCLQVLRGLCPKVNGLHHSI